MLHSKAALSLFALQSLEISSNTLECVAVRAADAKIMERFLYHFGITVWVYICWFGELLRRENAVLASDQLVAIISAYLFILYYIGIR